MSVVWKLAIALVVELGYAVFTRMWLPQYFEGVELELYKSAVRAFTALLYWALFRELIYSRTTRLSTARQPFFVISLVILMLAPVLAGAGGLESLCTQIVFAVTSIVVGIREELLYRGVLQNLFEKSFGWFWAIVCSNVLFTLYHYGAWPFTVPNVIEFFVVGSLLGLVYWGTGSLMLAIAIHAVYDAIWSFTPLLTHPLPHVWKTGLQLCALILMLYWARRLVGSNRPERAKS